MRGLYVLAVVMLTSTAAALAWPSAPANGGRAKKTEYEGVLPCGRDSVATFSSELEDVLFQLNSVQNKYRVIRIRIVNGCPADLKLSREADVVELLFAGGPVTGILDLAKRDTPLWDALSADLREKLVYPARVQGPAEEESVFVFIPKEKASVLPQGFRYRIASLGKTVAIRNKTARARL